MLKSIKIFKLFGIDIELHYSWFFVILLLAWGLSSDFFPYYYPGLTVAEYWGISIAASILLFCSVLAHEMSHSLVARRNNIQVDKITLFFFGGIAHINGTEDNLTPGKEFRMAIAGPLMSAFLALIFFVLFKQVDFIYINSITYYLYKLNFILALFNMAPGYPLDGGRVLRSIVWHFTKDMKKATSIASKGGKAVAFFLISFGFIGMILGAGTLWYVILGFFLYFIAGASYEQMIIKEILEKVKIKDVMIKEVKAVSPDLSIASLFQNYFLKYGSEGALVAKNKVFLGVITIDALKTVPKQKWAKAKIKQVFIPASKVRTVKETDNAFSVLSLMSENNLGIMPVIKNKKLVGAVSIASLLNYANLKQKVL